MSRGVRDGWRASVLALVAAALAVAVAVAVSLLAAGPVAAAGAVSHDDTVAYTYGAPALLSAPNAATSYARGSTAGPGAASWGRSVFFGGCCTAAEAGAPLIKVGSAGGETAGKVFPQSIRQQALAENPSTCVYCRMETQTPQVDHVIPRSTGGNATLENAQTTCPWCNASKGARDFPVNPAPGYRGAWPPEWWGDSR